MFPEKLLQYQLLLQARFVDKTLLDHSRQTKSRRQHERMRVRSRTRQVYDAEYATAFGTKNRRARAGKTGEDIREVLATFDEERLAFSDCRADTVRTDRLFGENVAGGKLEPLEEARSRPGLFHADRAPGRGCPRQQRTS